MLSALQSIAYRRVWVKIDEAADSLRPLPYHWGRLIRIHYREWGLPYSGKHIQNQLPPELQDRREALIPRLNAHSIKLLKVVRPSGICQAERTRHRADRNNGECTAILYDRAVWRNIFFVSTRALRLRSISWPLDAHRSVVLTPTMTPLLNPGHVRGSSTSPTDSNIIICNACKGPNYSLLSRFQQSVAQRLMPQLSACT